MNNENQRLAKWNKWLEGIQGEIIDLIWCRFILREVFGIVKANPKIDGTNQFFQWMLVTCGRTLAVGIRHQVDKSSQAVSFAKLLCEIQSSPWVLSVEPDEVQNDLEQLVKKLRVVKKYTDKEIAHMDQIKSDEPLTYQEVYDCLDFLYDLLRKYWEVFHPTESSLPEAYESVFRHDWKQIFWLPWITEETIFNISGQDEALLG